ncbi:MAG TPA: hypothetical protein VNT99_04540, partial [Methylomirabilota bacterium]|nr:hypothetical protein [Methylomirabilota bacterium]
PGPPEFTRLPVGVSVAPGATIWLAAETRTPAALQWSFNGIDLPNETNNFLMFLNASSAQAGVYRVRANKAGFTIVSPDVLVQVRAPVTPPGGLRIGGDDVAQRTSGAMELRIRTLPGRLYSVERALDLNAALRGDWRVVAEFTGDGTVKTFVDLEADRNPSAFYRIGERTPNPAAPWSLSDGTRFVGLAQTGVPQPGLLPFQDPNTGLFGPFDLKVAGNELPEGAGLIIRFPNGARPVEANGQIILRARDIDVLFGPDSFLQFAGGDNGVHHIHSATDLDVPAGPVDMRLLERLLSKPVSNGVEVVCFGAFHLQLLEGVFDSDRIRNVQLSFLGRNGVPLALALPGRSGGFANFHLDLNGRRLRIPFHGDFPLPDGTGTPPVVRIPAQRPLWLELRSDNTIALGGSGVLDIPNGPRFATEFSFDDPDYALRISASRVEVPPLLGALDLLPRPPVVPSDATDGTLNVLSDQLECVSRATLNFSALTVGDASDPGAPMPGTPALEIGLAPLLEFWTCVAEHGMRPETAAATRAAADQAARDAESSDDLLQISVTLERNVRLRFLGSGQVEYQDAVNRATAAAKRVWRDVNCNTMDPTKVMAAATNVLRADTVLQGAGQSRNTELLNLAIALVRCSATAYCTRLGVTTGQFTAAPDSTIGRMPRRESLEHLRKLLTYHATAQALGDAPDHLGAPMREALIQLARRLWTEIETKLNSAIAANDRRAFLLLGEQTLDLLALIQTGILDDVSGLPTREVIEGKFNTAFLTSDDAEVTGDIFNRRFDQLRDDFQRMRQMLDALPSNVQSPPPGLERRHAKLGERLVQVVPQLTVESSFTLPDLLAVMESGLAYEELRLRLNRGGPNIWRTENRFTLTVTHLRNRAVIANDWSMLHLAAQAVLKEAARASFFGTNAVVTQQEQWRSFRRDCLIEAARLLESANTVGAGLWLAAEARRTSNPALALAGMALPQGFRIDHATGELRYNSATRRLRGAFRGNLVVPKVHGTFELLNGSFDTAGTFDVSAWGTVTLPAEEGLITLTVPKRRPLHVARKLDGHLTLEGAAQARLRNGITFDGFISLADPVYRLGASVGGLRFEMATNFTGLVQLPTPQRITALPVELRGIAAGYLARLGATLDPLTALTDAPGFEQMGEPPSFEAGISSQDIDTAEAAAHFIELLAKEPSFFGYNNITEAQEAVTNLFAGFATLIQRAQTGLAGAVVNGNQTGGCGPVVNELAPNTRALRAIKKVQSAQPLLPLELQGTLSGLRTDSLTKLDAAFNQLLADEEATRATTVGILTADDCNRIVRSAAEARITELLLDSDTDAARDLWSHYAVRRLEALRLSLGMTAAGVPLHSRVVELGPKRVGEVCAEMLDLASHAQRLGGVLNEFPADVMESVQALQIAQAWLDFQAVTNAPWPHPVVRSYQAYHRGKALMGRALLSAQQLGVGDIAVSLFDQEVEQAGAPYHQMLEAMFSNEPPSDEMRLAIVAFKEYTTAELRRSVFEHQRTWDDLPLDEYLATLRAGATTPPQIARHNQLLAQIRDSARAEFMLLTNQVDRPEFRLAAGNALEVLRRAVALASLVEEAGWQQGGANLHQLQLTDFRVRVLPRVTGQITALAEARQAWWMVGRATEIMLARLEDKPAATFNLVDHAVAEVAADTLTQTASLLGAVKQALRPADF